jgi:hypothetical protein
MLVPSVVISLKQTSFLSTVCVTEPVYGKEERNYIYETKSREPVSQRIAESN